MHRKDNKKKSITVLIKLKYSWTLKNVVITLKV